MKKICSDGKVEKCKEKKGEEERRGAGSGKRVRKEDEIGGGREGGREKEG